METLYVFVFQEDILELFKNNQIIDLKISTV